MITKTGACYESVSPILPNRSGTTTSLFPKAGKEKVVSRLLHQNLMSLIWMTGIEYSWKVNKI